LPISDQLRSVARYYQALCRWRRGEIDSPRQFEHAVEEAPPQYRARALQAVGSAYYECGEVDAALPFYFEAGRAATSCDLVTLAYSQWMTAEVRGIHGDHQQAVEDLERLFPLVRAVGKYFPVLYYDFLNSLAVELGEVGRIAEAEGACAIALASPFAAVHPNWIETRDEIAAKRVSATPSIVAVNHAPEAAPSPLAEPKRKPKPLGTLAFTWPRCKKTSVQRTSRIAACATIPHDEITQTILDRVLVCIGSRAPPARY
jgi:tetratricopeptide (TPR) repeat protein